MAKRKRSSSSRSSKRRRRHGRNSLRRTIIPYSTAGVLGPSVVKYHKYSEYFTINPGIGVLGNYVFSATGMYDPNYTGTGGTTVGLRPTS